MVVEREDYSKEYQSREFNRLEKYACGVRVAISGIVLAGLVGLVSFYSTLPNENRLTPQQRREIEEIKKREKDPKYILYKTIKNLENWVKEQISNNITLR